MNKLNENRSNIDLYERIQRTPMSESERLVALNAVRNADAIVDGLVWAVNGVKRVIAKVLEKPASLKHSH